MSKFILFIALIVFQTATAQKMKITTPAEIKVPMTADRWDFPPDKVEFITYKSYPAMHILNNRDVVTLKNFTFTTGTIEFDIAPADSIFTGIYFRRKDSTESELFYLRIPSRNNPGLLSAVQYTPVVKNVNLWDMYPQYQGPANYKINDWNHLKLVVSASQLRVYINDLTHPVMDVPQLEGNVTEGSLALFGKSAFANLVIQPNQTENLLSTPGPDPTAYDPRFLRQWQVSQPVDLPPGHEPYLKTLPDSTTTWENIWSERRGLVNLTRRFGLSKTRRLVWLKVKLKAATAQTRHVNFGFSDEVWVFINGRTLFVDKNFYAQPIAKDPGGRCSIDNTSFTLPLKQGINELLIGVSNDFYGWGIIARLDAMDDIEVIKE